MTVRMDLPHEKDPRRQLIGKMSKIKGRRFEDRLDRTFGYYSETGFAKIEKTPEPMKPIKDLGNGRFIACYEKKAQPDYKGTIKGGRTVIFEAKYTEADKMEQSRVKNGQSHYLDLHHSLGARCYVIIGFRSGMVYCIPWTVWREMKKHFGHKYVTESEVQQYKVDTAWNDTLLIL